MTRRSFLASAAVAPLFAAPEAKKPNLVFILCDDLGVRRSRLLGSSIRTPNLDRLAAEGIRFTNFDSADPVCSP